MKRIIPLLIAVMLLCACAGRADIQPLVRTDGHAEAYVREGILHVRCEEGRYAAAVTVNGERVWLCDGQYAIGACGAQTQVRVHTEAYPKVISKQEADSIVLSLYDPDRNAYSVTWHTQLKNYPLLKLRRLGEETERTVTGYCDEGSGDYVSRAVIYGLEKNAEYAYTLCDAGGNESFAGSFTAGDPQTDAVTFMHISDTQDTMLHGSVWAELMRSAAQKKGLPDMILHTGDIVQNGGVESDWKQMLGHVRDYVSSVPFMAASGNHSYWERYKNGYEDIEHKHITVKLPAQNTNNGIYYSYDYGDVHFTVLSSGDSPSSGVGEKQLKWLENDLARAEKRWKIVLIHNPLYSCGRWGSNDSVNGVAKALRESVGSLLCRYGVDLVLQGHDHVFSLTLPITQQGVPEPCAVRTVQEAGAEIYYYVQPSSPVYLVSGAGGSQNRAVEEAYDRAIFSQAQSVPANTACYSLITVSKTRLTAAFYEYDYQNHEQRRIYCWGIDKGEQ